MSSKIILTSSREEGLRLQEYLVNRNIDFRDIRCKIKEDLIDTEKCEFIFSTWYMPHFSKEEAKVIFPNLKAIFYAAGTVKDFAVPFLKRGVRIFSAASANGLAVAEYTVGQILLANKGYFQATKSFHWPIWKIGFRKIRYNAEKHIGNFNPIVGLLGCGSIGSKVVKLLKSFDIKILVYDPYLSNEQVNDLGVECVDIHSLFRYSDIVSNHLPDIETTKNLIDYNLLSTMKPYATFINTGRGAQINEKDLVRVMRKRKDLTALLDVTSHEPPFPWSSLYHCKNIFMSPHIAGSINKEIDRMYEFVYNSYIQFINGDVPEGEVFLSQLVNKA